MNFNKLFPSLLTVVVCYMSCSTVVEEIRIEGREIVPVEVISPYIEISVGQDVDAVGIQSQIKLLYKTQLFKQVKVNFESGILTINLFEQPVIQKVSISSAVMDQKQVNKQLEKIGLVKGELFSERMLEQWRVGAQASLRSSGFDYALVTTKVEPAGEKTVSIEIKVEEGSATKLRSVVFKGDTQFPTRTLERRVSSATTNIASFIRNNDLYSEYNLEQDRKSLISFYKDKGYRAPRVSYKSTDVVPVQRIWSSQYKSVEFEINAGPQFYVSEIEFSDEKDQWPEELKNLLLEALEGELGDLQIKHKAQAVLTQYYQDEKQGAFFRVHATDSVIGYDKLKVKLSLDKKVSYVRFIHISGNTHTLDEPLRRALIIEESKPFDESMIKFSEYSLKNYQFLKDAKIQSVAVGDNEYDLFVSVTETPSSFTAELQGSFSSGSPFGAKVSTADKNFLGTANALELSVNAAASQQQISLSYFQPKLNIKGHSLTSGITFSRQSKETEKTIAYQSNTMSLATSYALPVTNYVRGNVGAAYIYNDYQNIGVASTLVRDYFKDKATTTIEQYKLLAGLSYSQIDSAYMPTKGASGGLSAVATLPVFDAATYYQFTADLKAYYPLGEMMDQPIVLRTKLLAQYGQDYQDTDREMPFFARYNAGGLGTVRGYSPGSLGPMYEDLIYEKDEDGLVTDIIKSKVDKVKGGNKLLAGTVELQLPSPAPDFLTPYLFVDAGNVFDDKDSIDLSELRASVGASVLLRLPIGNVTVSAAVPVNNSSDDKFSTISFGMGTMF